MKEDTINVTAEWWDESLNVFAIWRGRKVGHAYCQLEAGNMRINDLIVYDTVVMPKCWGWIKTNRDFRGQGIGTRILRSTISEANKKGAVTIDGYITSDDAISSPWLQSWYLKHGFQIFPPDGTAERNFEDALKILCELKNLDQTG